jgi:hypothetical protein
MKINGFIWDTGNLGHLEEAHPHYELEMLEEIVLAFPKKYIGTDSRNNKVYAAQKGKITILFNHRDNKARIFSIRIK